MRLSRCVKKILFVTVLASISTVSLADWDVQRVYVKKVDQFATASAVTRVIYEFVPGVSGKVVFGCAQNDTEIPGLPNHYQAVYWAGGTNAFHQILVGQLLAAQAQNIPIDILFDATGCNNNPAYFYGGMGRMMRGVSVSSD